MTVATAQMKARSLNYYGPSGAHSSNDAMRTPPLPKVATRAFLAATAAAVTVGILGFGYGGLANLHYLIALFGIACVAGAMTFSRLDRRLAARSGWRVLLATTVAFGAGLSIYLILIPLWMTINGPGHSLRFDIDTLGWSAAYSALLVPLFMPILLWSARRDSRPT